MASRRPKNDRRKQDKRLKRLRTLKHKGERSPGDPKTTLIHNPPGMDLKHKGERSPGDPKILLIHNPPGMEKMSKVLERFAEPYMENVTLADQGLHKLYTLCVMAWNAALRPENEQEEVIDEIVRTYLTRGTEADRRVFRRLVESMIERKKTHFPNVKRAILSFDLKDMGDTYYLNVASTLG
jgi:hypothetical protein